MGAGNVQISKNAILQKFVSVHASVFNYFNHELSLNKRDKFNHKADLAE